jgi:hypothetical protein
MARVRWPVVRQETAPQDLEAYRRRALDADPAADLSPLAAAARRAGLDEPEITRTLGSARKTRQARTHQAEAVD